MLHDEKLYDITVIGGGPAGLFATFYAGMRGASVKLIESMPQLGGQLSALYPEKYIYDVAGFPEILAKDLINNLINQLNAHHEPTILLEEKVLNVEKKEDGNFLLTTDKGTHLSKTVVIAGGIGAFEPRPLELENAKQFEGKNLYYFVNDMNMFKDLRVLINGGGDSAVDWALMLEPIAKEVIIVHRRDQFRAHEHTVEKLMNSSIKVVTPATISKIEGREKIEKVTVSDVKTKEERTFDVDAVVVNFGFVSSLGPILEWGLEIENGTIKVNSKMETNIPGIYAVGDICSYPGKIKLIAAGFGEAPTAINNAKNYIDPTSRVQPVHKH